MSCTPVKRPHHRSGTGVFFHAYSLRRPTPVDIGFTVKLDAQQGVKNVPVNVRKSPLLGKPMTQILFRSSVAGLTISLRKA